MLINKTFFIKRVFLLIFASPMKKIHFTLILFLISIITFGQTKISGKVIDSNTKKPIAYADLSLPNLMEYTFANSDGSFYLESEDNDSILEVRAQGYVTKEIVLNSRINYDLTIELDIVSPMDKDETVELDGVVITQRKRKYRNKKENPAYAILREVWARKKQNGLKNVPHYEYEEYEKLQFDLNNIDSAFINHRLFKDMEFVFENVDTSNVSGKAYLPLFINESIYKVYGQNSPNKGFRRDLIANKNSGFENNEIVIHTLKNLYKDYDIYDNRLNFFNINFVSPIARDGFSVYEYELSDTVEIDGINTYRIKYYPRRSGEHTFKGDFYIATENYAVKEITMESTRSMNVNFVRDIFVYHQYDLINDSVFYPKRDYVLLDMSLLDKKNSSKGMFAHRTVSYKDFDLDTPREADFYNDRNYDPYLSGAYEKEDDFWANARHEELSKNEGGIYMMLDSLQTVPRFNNIVKAVEVLGSGYYNVWNAIDIGNLYSSFGYNEIEGFRLRAGARTYFSPNDMWRVAAYTAYGFKDKQFKYGVEARMMFDKYNRFQVGIGTKRDIEQLGVQLTSSSGIMERTFASSSVISQGKNDWLSHINKTSVYTSVDPWKNFTIRLDGNYQTIRSADPELFNIGYVHNGFYDEHLIDTNVSLSFIARPGAKFSNYGIDRFEHITLAPTILLRYTKGFSGLFNSQFNYDKIQFLYQQPLLIGSLGRTNIIIEAGKTFDAVPMSLLSVIPGNESYGQVPGTFTQLDYYEFLTDTYSTLMIDHQFRGWIFNKIPLIKKLKIREVAFFRAAWGEISDANIEMNHSDVNYLAPKDQIYYEYGFGIENIGFGNIRPLRIDFNWRGNYLHLPDARKFGVTVGLDFSF